VAGALSTSSLTLLDLAARTARSAAFAASQTSDARCERGLRRRIVVTLDEVIRD